jgi:transposase
MSSRPKTKDEIAKRTGLSRGTVTLYLQQFGCFQSAGRGKGYVYNKPKDLKE